jgi:hypothetical protein
MNCQSMLWRRAPAKTELATVNIMCRINTDANGVDQPCAVRLRYIWVPVALRAGGIAQSSCFVDLQSPQVIPHVQLLDMSGEKVGIGTKKKSTKSASSPSESQCLEHFTLVQPRITSPSRKSCSRRFGIAAVLKTNFICGTSVHTRLCTENGPAPGSCACRS